MKYRNSLLESQLNIYQRDRKSRPTIEEGLLVKLYRREVKRACADSASSSVVRNMFCRSAWLMWSNRPGAAAQARNSEML